MTQEEFGNLGPGDLVAYVAEDRTITGVVLSSEEDLYLSPAVKVHFIGLGASVLDTSEAGHLRLLQRG